MVGADGGQGQRGGATNASDSRVLAAKAAEEAAAVKQTVTSGKLPAY